VIKKTFFHPKSDPIKRAEFENQLLYFEHIEKRNIVYIDESGFAQDIMATAVEAADVMQAKTGIAEEG
jgi:hypothetical protein